MLIWKKVRMYAVMAASVLLAVGLALIVGIVRGRSAGKKAMVGKVAVAKMKAAISDQVADQATTRMKVNAQVANADRPKPTVPANTAVDSNLGGWLRDGGNEPKPK